MKFRDYVGLAMGFIMLSGMLSTSMVLASGDDDGDARDRGHQPRVVKSKVIEGVAVLGDNNAAQKAMYNIPDLGPAYFNWVYAYNPNGSTPTIIPANAPKNTVLAGGIDPLAQAIGLIPAHVDPSMINVPLHQTPVVVDGAGTRAQVPSAAEQPGSTTSRSLPSKPITLGKWMQAKGTMKIRCYADDTATVDIRLTNLIENGVYSLWTIYLADRDGDGQTDGVAPYALGGVPNVIVPDANNSATVSRKLGFCPLTDPKLIFIDIAFHSDGSVYGGAPDQPFASFSQPMGSVTHTHVEFPMNVTPIE